MKTFTITAAAFSLAPPSTFGAELQSFEFGTSRAFEAASAAAAPPWKWPPVESLALYAGIVFFLFLLLIQLGRWLKRRRGVHLGIFYILFCAAFALWLPHYFSALPWRSMLVKHLGAVTLFLGTLFLLALLRRFFWEGWFERTHGTRAPKFLSQLVGIAVVVAMGFVIFSLVYERSIQAALLSSTVVVGIIGFAMQDLLGNIIAGVALEIGKPFKPGDWLVVDKRHAEVIEVNWRSTRLRDNDNICYDIPNKHIVGSTIVNMTYPTREHAMRIVVGFDYSQAPNHVKDCLLRATKRAPGVLVKPPPKVFLKDFAESAINYEIKFSLEDEARFNDILDGIKTNIWYEAQRSGLRIPFPIRTLHLERTRLPDPNSASGARTHVRKLPFLEILDEAQTDMIIRSARQLRFGRGERIIEQGDEGRSMFILLRGEATVCVRCNEVETEVARLREGDCFGEMSLLTGEPRSATVIARTDCEMWELSKEVLGELLQNNNVLVEKLSDLLAKRRLENEGHLAHAQQSAVLAQRHREYRAGFLSKLTTFFEL